MNKLHYESYLFYIMDYMYFILFYYMLWIISILYYALCYIYYIMIYIYMLWIISVLYYELYLYNELYYIYYTLWNISTVYYEWYLICIMDYIYIIYYESYVIYYELIMNIILWTNDHSLLFTRWPVKPTSRDTAPCPVNLFTGMLGTRTRSPGWTVEFLWVLQEATGVSMAKHLSSTHSTFPHWLVCPRISQI